MFQLEFLSIPNILIAYLDPGSGSLLIQLLIAALFGMGFFLNSIKDKIKNLFGIKTKDSKAEDLEDNIDDDLIDE